jgi:hypothetical protein
MPLLAVITDKISLKDEMISAVEEDVLFDVVLVPVDRPETAEMGLEMVVIMHLFYS